MNKKLYIFVENFSEDKKEEFFEKELPFLSEKFEKIIVIPLYKGNHNLVYSNHKIEIKQFDAFVACNRVKIFFENFFLIWSIFFYEFFKTHNKKFYLKNAFNLINTLVLRIASAKALYKEIEKDISESVFYTYWFNQWTFILTIIKRKHPELKIVTRAHGSDYKEEQTNSTLAFRYFQLRIVNYVMPVSDYAKKYFIEKFDMEPRKIYVNRLGLPENITLSPIDASVLHLVSCSSVISLKRVHLILEVLKYITIPVSWHHFGTGPEIEKIEQGIKNLPLNARATLKGYLPNKEFISYLEKSAVSFFINVSQYEGIPVSLMEAARCGIPLIGTNVCGIPEIVTSDTGFIIPLDFDPKAVASLIEEEHNKGFIYSMEFRTKVQGFYRTHFSARSNCTQFSQFLFSLN